MIRIATDSDVPAISRIYNHYVDHSTCTFHMRRETIEERMTWLREHGDMHPVVVTESDGEVVGWASLSHFNPRCAYRKTAEVSVYIDHRFHRRGLGRALLSDLIERARALDYHVLIGGVCTEQTASLQLQRSMGFVEVARFKEVGYKFDRWLDVAYLQLMLDEPT